MECQSWMCILLQFSTECYATLKSKIPNIMSNNSGNLLIRVRWKTLLTQQQHNLWTWHTQETTWGKKDRSSTTSIVQVAWVDDPWLDQSSHQPSKLTRQLHKATCHIPKQTWLAQGTGIKVVQILSRPKSLGETDKMTKDPRSTIYFMRQPGNRSGMYCSIPQIHLHPPPNYPSLHPLLVTSLFGIFFISFLFSPILSHHYFHSVLAHSLLYHLITTTLIFSYSL